MVIANCKIYNNGSHYIAIPPTEGKGRKRIKKEQPKIEVELNATMGSGNKPPTVEMTKKEYFELLYREYVDLPRWKQKNIIIQKMMKYFKNREETKLYVDEQFKRLRRNYVMRSLRFSRKVYLHEFNYFCTFTYDDEKHTEESFQKALKRCFKDMCYRRGWNYVGVWERSPEKKRLHFHGLFDIPKEGMIGELVEVVDYSLKRKRREKTIQNTYFNKRFGRSDFSSVNGTGRLSEAMAYLMKYIEKTGERLVYSRGLSTYFYSDIMDEDIICEMSEEESDNKLLLADNFMCYDEGCAVGRVSKEVIKQLRRG